MRFQNQDGDINVIEDGLAATEGHSDYQNFTHTPNNPEFHSIAPLASLAPWFIVLRMMFFSPSIQETVYRCFKDNWLPLYPQTQFSSLMCSFDSFRVSIVKRTTWPRK
jgi:hypothetical protein